MRIIGHYERSHLFVSEERVSHQVKDSFASIFKFDSQLDSLGWSEGDQTCGSFSRNRRQSILNLHI